MYLKLKEETYVTGNWGVGGDRTGQSVTLYNNSLSLSLSCVYSQTIKALQPYIYWGLAVFSHQESETATGVVVDQYWLRERFPFKIVPLARMGPFGPRPPFHPVTDLKTLSVIKKKKSCEQKRARLSSAITQHAPHLLRPAPLWGRAHIFFSLVVISFSHIVSLSLYCLSSPCLKEKLYCRSLYYRLAK